MLTLGTWFLWGLVLIGAAGLVVGTIATRVHFSYLFGDLFQMQGGELISAGLALDIIGVILLWRFRLPESVNRSGRVYRVTAETDPIGPLKAKFCDFFPFRASRVCCWF